MNRFSQELQRLLQREQETTSLTLASLLEISQERMFGVLLVILALPMAIPMPHFGLAFPVAAVLILLGVQMLLGHRLPWLPQRLLDYDMSQGWIQKLLRLGLPWLQRMERIARPRFERVCTSVPGKILLATAVILATVLMALPIPATNAPPAIGILLVGVGLLEEDGLLSLVGVGVCFGTVALATAIVTTLLFYGIDLSGALAFVSSRLG